MNIKCVDPGKKEITDISGGSSGLGIKHLDLVFTAVQSEAFLF